MRVLQRLVFGLALLVTVAARVPLANAQIGPPAGGVVVAAPANCVTTQTVQVRINPDGSITRITVYTTTCTTINPDGSVTVTVTVTTITENFPPPPPPPPPFQGGAGDLIAGGHE